jgi:hypothetical protein
MSNIRVRYLIVIKIGMHRQAVVTYDKKVMKICSLILQFLEMEDRHRRLTRACNNLPL